MATESPIRMMEARGKWSSHPGTASFTSSPVNMSMDAEGLLVKGQYQSGKPMAPARSGSAPPSMEGSLAAFENLVHNSVLGSGSPSRMLKDSSSSTNYSSNYHVLGRVGSSSSSYVNISRGALPTHKEESDDDRSPQRASDDLMDKSSAVWSGRELSSSIGRHRSLVDLKQVNASRTSSPVSDQLLAFSHGSAGEVADSDADYSSPDQPSRMPNLMASTLCVDDVDSTRQTDLSSASALRSASLVSLEDTIPPGKKDAQSHINSNQRSEVITCGAFGIKSLQSGLKNLDISSPENLDLHPTHEERPVFYQNNFVKHQISQQNSSLQFQGFIPQVLSQGMNDVYMDINQIPYVGKLPTSEVQPVLQSSGFTPPIYSPNAAYIPSASAYYSGMPHPGVMYPSQYGLGGYALNPAYYSQYVTGYSQNALPFTFDGPPTPQYNARTSGIPSPSGSSNSVDMQSLNKYYGHYGILQNSFSDPNMQYRPPYGDFYNVPGQLEPLGIRDNVIGAQGNSSISQKKSDLTSLSSDNRSQNQGAGGMNQRRGGFATPNFYGNSTNVGVFLPIPSATLPSHVLPASPMGGSNQSYGRGEPRFPTDSGRNTSLHPGWSDQRVFESVNYSKTYSFLEELKSGKGRRLELSDIVGHVVEFSVDQHGSRFIQQKLEHCNVEEKSSVFKEVLPHASKLMTDVFGNYVIQKFFEYGTLEQRRELANQLRGQILPLSLQMYGCRVIQKALDIIELEQKAELVRELDGHVMKCVRDQNGNHVIQKCIESIPAEKIDFIISAFHGQVAILSMHPYGCRVIQRVLEHCSDGWQCQFIVDEILESVCDLAQNQYGNYVTQHVLERGQPQERSQIIKKLSAKVVPLSQHKFASNVIEKCLEYGDAESRGLLIEEVIGQNDGNDNLLVMMKDQYANYVVQKILDMCTESQQDLLLCRIKVHLNALKKYTYGKHIVARVEALCGEEAQS